MQVNGAGRGSCAPAFNFPSAPARKGEHETAIPIYQLLQLILPRHAGALATVREARQSQQCEARDDLP